MAVWWYDGWLSFTGEELTWKPANALQVVALYCPQDQQIIDSIGITPDEYYDFLDQCEYACNERGLEYSHIPDVRNEPTTVSIVLTVVGIALQVAGALLAPKPKVLTNEKHFALKPAIKPAKAISLLTTTSTLFKN